MLFFLVFIAFGVQHAFRSLSCTSCPRVYVYVSGKMSRQQVSPQAPPAPPPSPSIMAVQVPPLVHVRQYLAVHPLALSAAAAAAAAPAPRQQPKQMMQPPAVKFCVTKYIGHCPYNVLLDEPGCPFVHREDLNTAENNARLLESELVRVTLTVDSLHQKLDEQTKLITELTARLNERDIQMASLQKTNDQLKSDLKESQSLASTLQNEMALAINTAYKSLPSYNNPALVLTQRAVSPKNVVSNSASPLYSLFDAPR